MNNYEKNDAIQEDDNQSEAEKVLGSMPSFEEFRKSIEKNDDLERKSFDQNLIEVMEQYEYDEKLQNMLKDIAPKIADYYDNEEAVIEVLKKCRIFMLEPEKNSNEKANSYLDEEVEIPTVASGAAIISPRINDNGDIEIKKAIIVRDSEKSSQTLVHEICHQVASVKKEPKLEPDGRIRIDIGLCSEYYGKDEDGKMKITESKYSYLEEMTNSYDTEIIMKNIKGQEYQSNEYNSLRKMLSACPTNTIEKLRQLRAQTNSAEIIADQDILKQTSQILDDYMNIPRKVLLSKRMAGGDREKAREIRSNMDQASRNQVVENLTAWSA